MAEIPHWRGPWFSVPSDRTVPQTRRSDWIIQDQAGVELAVVKHDCGRVSLPARENAAIMCHAPELYHAVRLFLFRGVEDEEAIQMLRRSVQRIEQECP